MTSFDTNEVLVWEANNQTAGVFGQANQEDSGLNGPTDLAFNGNGTLLFVSSSVNDKVLQFNVTTEEFIGVAADEGIISPEGISFDENEDLVVASRATNELIRYGESKIDLLISDWTTGDDTIYAYDMDGDLIRSINLDGLLDNPKNIAADSEAKVWIADFGNQSLVKLERIDERQAVPIGSELKIDLSNLVIFKEEPREAVELKDKDKTIVYIDAEGNMFPTENKTFTTSVSPQGISFDDDDNIFVSDWEKNRVIILNKDGEFLSSIKVNSTFTEPFDIAVPKKGEGLFATETSDSFFSNIFVYDAKPNGTSIPQILSINPQKQLKVTEFRESLSPLMRGLSSNGTYLFTTPSNSGSLLEIAPDFNMTFNSRHFIVPNGLDVEEDFIYVTDWKEGRIVKLAESSGQFENEFDMTGEIFFNVTALRDIEFVPSQNDDSFRISDPVRATITEVGTDGMQVDILPVADKFIFLSGLDVDDSDNFIVASNLNETAIKFDNRNRFLAESDFKVGNSIMVDITLSPDDEAVFLAVSETKARVGRRSPR